MDASETSAVRIEDLLKHREWVAALARSLVRDESTALDLVQDTWTTALTRPPARSGSLRAWLGTVLRNRLRDRRRVEYRRTRREEKVSSAESTPSAADLAAAADAHRRVMDAVVSLSEPYRETVLLRFYEGLSLTEVAERQGIPASTARTRLKRALDRLRESLDERSGRDGRAWAVALVPLLTERPAPTGGLGGFLMAHKFKIVAASLLALVGVSVIVSARSPDHPPVPDRRADAEIPAVNEEPVFGETGEAGGQKQEAGSQAFRLPETTRRDALPVPIEDTVVLEVAADGTITLGIEGEKPLLHRLLLFAEEKRDLGHPMQPSNMGVLLRADTRAPWRAVREALGHLADPDVRIYRMYWAARRGEAEVGVPVFGAKDRGLARTKAKWITRLPRHIVLSRNTVRYLDRDLGKGDAAFEALAGYLPAREEAVRKHPVAVRADDDAPFGHVVRVMDLLPKPYAEHFVAWLPEPIGLLEDDKKTTAKGTVEELEARFIPRQEDRDRVREILANSELPLRTLRELSKMIDRSASLALGLGIAYADRGGADDCLRAVALSRLVVFADPSARYGARWWDAERLLLRAMLGYGRAKDDRRAFEMAQELAAAYSRLGLLERSPLRAEIVRLAGAIDAELEKLDSD